MTAHGPPFYDSDEWEPDEPTLKELIGLPAMYAGTVLLQPWQLHAIQKAMIEEFGRFWRRPFAEFLNALTPAAEVFNKVATAAAPLCEAVAPPKPPKNGPQFNPHARRGKGDRRR